MITTVLGKKVDPKVEHFLRVVTRQRQLKGTSYLTRDHFIHRVAAKDSAVSGSCWGPILINSTENELISDNYNQ